MKKPWHQGVCGIREDLEGLNLTIHLLVICSISCIPYLALYKIKLFRCKGFIYLLCLEHSERNGYNHEKNLIVEDDTHINSLLHDLLTTHGHQVVQVYSGTEGLMCFDAQAFDLVLLDLMLPGITGDVVLATIRKNNHIPIIILTAVADKEKTVTLLKLGANDYVVKPFNNDELLARMDIWLRQKIMNPQHN